jgi:ribosomal protein S18 acetylase RimI-like enzyme
MASRHVAKLGIIVIQSLRNLGVGRALMTAAENAAVAKEYEKIVLSTFNDNELALSLYQSLGYRTVGYRVRHFKMERGYVDEVLMEKILEGVQDWD